MDLVRACHSRMSMCQGSAKQKSGLVLSTLLSGDANLQSENKVLEVLEGRTPALKGGQKDGKETRPMRQIIRL